MKSVLVNFMLTAVMLETVDGIPDGNFMTDSRRFLMAHHGNLPWLSWRQHVACLTTCVPGFEAQTVACCTTGDNRLCLNLPYALLNSSIGTCQDFCQRRSLITCTGSTKVCGSDGVTYSNMCEFSKAVCADAMLKEELNGPCPQTTTAVPTLDPIQKVFCANKNSIVCTVDMDPICGSDKQFYLNTCNFAKARCDDPSLTELNYNVCTQAVN